VLGWLIDPTAVTGHATDDTAINQEEQDRHAARKRRFRPVHGPGQIVFEMQPRIAKRLLDQRFEVLVTPVGAIVSQQLDPLTRQVANG
jgi:hypothetical protein